MDEYKPNSHKFREENEKRSSDTPEKHIEAVVSGPVKTKKKSLGRKLTDAFIQEDMKSVMSVVFEEVFIPSIKKIVSDIISNGVDMLFWGQTGRSKNNSTSSKVSYRSYYDNRSDRNDSGRKTRTAYDYNDIILDSRGEAEDVLDRLRELIDMYRVASVADLYDLVGISSNHTDNNYGWADISSAAVIRVREGYLLKMPRALPIN